ncbi:MAG: DinB family protein [Candidatus Aminicenantes bacterium]|nr:DinB family protein [Candidatus Aminicenantes bacterium]
MDKEKILRKEILALLNGQNAHLNLDRAIRDFPRNYIHQTVEGIPYTPWQLLEHIRLAQWDILEFMVNPGHVSPEFPDGYWPDPERIPTWKEWKTTLQGIQEDLEKVKTVVRDTGIELMSEIPHAPGYTYFREVVLVADHNAFHLGGLVVLRRLMGIFDS